MMFLSLKWCGIALSIDKKQGSKNVISNNCKTTRFSCSTQILTMIDIIII